MEKPLIGAYANPTPESTPAAAPPVADAVITDKRPAKVETPALNMQVGIESDLLQDVSATQATVAKAKTYSEILADNEIDETKAQTIVDSILTEGFYEEAVLVTKRTTVTLRTRSYGSYQRYLRALELINPHYVEEQQGIMIRYFLAASLVAFKGHTFAHAPEGATPAEEEKFFDIRLDWITRKNERVINLLAAKLNKFDRMVQVVMSEGVVENF